MTKKVKESHLYRASFIEKTSSNPKEIFLHSKNQKGLLEEIQSFLKENKPRIHKINYGERWKRQTSQKTTNGCTTPPGKEIGGIRALLKPFKASKVAA